MESEFEEEGVEGEAVEEEVTEEGGGAVEEVGGEVYRIMFPKGKEVRYVFGALAMILQEANLVIDSDGIRLRSIDPSKVSLIILNIPSAGLEEFSITKEVKVGLSFDMVKKVLKRVRAREKVEFSIDTMNKRFNIIIYGKKGRESGYYRRFGLPIIGVAEEEVPEPKLEYPVRIRMDVDVFLELVSSADEITDAVTLIANEESFTIKAVGEGGKALEATYLSSDEVFYDYVVKGAHEATYSTEYILDVTRQMRQVCETVALEFMTNKPLKLTYDFAMGSVQFYLAPRA